MVSASGSFAQIAYGSDSDGASEQVNASTAVAFGYDNDKLLTGATLGSDSLAVTRESQSGRVSGTTLGPVTDTYTYDSYGDVASYAATYSGQPLYDYQVTQRDNLGRIAEKVETVGGTTDTYDYTYDLSGCLTDVSKDGAPLSHYDYDSNGNRNGGFTGSQGSILTTSYDDQDRLLEYSTVGGGDAAYEYTANGELESKTVGGETTTYSYDALGNLRHVVLPDGTVIDYVIDGQNRRVGKKVNGALLQAFLYKDQLNPVAELDGAGNVVAQLVYGTKANVPDYVIIYPNTVDRLPGTYRIISDHLGSVRLVVNTADGTIAQRMDYDEFGNVLVDTPPGFQPFGFAGGIYDPDTGMVRFGARDYDPGVGRWTAKDPIGFDGGDTELYGYVVNDPVNRIDAFGMQFLPPGGAVLPPGPVLVPPPFQPPSLPSVPSIPGVTAHNILCAELVGNCKEQCKRNADGDLAGEDLRDLCIIGCERPENPLMGDCNPTPTPVPCN